MKNTELLRQHGLKAKRSLAQNFLVDETHLACIAAAADLTSADVVLEIGPGLGGLTRYLAAQAGRVIAVELDNRLIDLLRQEFAHQPQVTIVHGDILELDPAVFVEDRDQRPETGDWRLETGDRRPETRDWKPETRDWRPETRDQRPETGDWRPETGDQRLETGDWRPETGDQRLETGDKEERGGQGGGVDDKGAIQNPKSKIQNSYKVVANLPYYITSAVLRHLLEAQRPPTMIVVLVQKEVAERICAPPGDLSILAVSVQYYAQPQIVHRVPAGAFQPRPKVDSAVLRLDVYPQPAVAGVDSAYFFQVVHAGFSQKRKQLVNTLSAGLALPKAQVIALLQQAGIDPHRRAETLTLHEWETLCHVLKKGN